MMKRIGKKSLATEARHRVSIYEDLSTTDEDGGVNESLSLKYENISAAIYPKSAQQVMEYKTLNVDATHLIKFRGYIDIEELDTIFWGARKFEVLTKENIQERNFELLVTCRENRE